MKKKTPSPFSVRLDEELVTKLQRLARETDRSQGSVVRILIRQAEVGNIRDVRLPPTGTGQRTSRAETDTQTRSATSSTIPYEGGTKENIHQ